VTRRGWVLAGVALLAACSREPAAESRQRAEPAVSPTPQPTPTLARPVGEPAVPAPGSPRPETSLAEGPFAPDSAQGAADVVQTYAALIEEGRTAEARRLWVPGVVAPTITRWREVRTNVGGPGPIEGAAGSRYVTVPVRFEGQLEPDGRRVVEDGTITLRRVGEVDGATPGQRRWHIYSAQLSRGGSRAAPGASGSPRP